MDGFKTVTPIGRNVVRMSTEGREGAMALRSVRKRKNCR